MCFITAIAKGHNQQGHVNCLYDVLKKRKPDFLTTVTIRKH